MAKKVYDEDGLDMQKTDWSGDESTGNLPVSGRLVENYIKSIDDKATPTEELAAGETKAPTSGAVFASLVGTVTNIDVTDSEDGTQYVMTVTQKDGEGGESDREVRFSKYSDDDQVVEYTTDPELIHERYGRVRLTPQGRAIAPGVGGDDDVAVGGHELEVPAVAPELANGTLRATFTE